jgi:hypothetical protein
MLGIKIGQVVVLKRPISYYRFLYNVYVTRLFFGQISRMFFGNDAGFKENLIGRYEVRKASSITSEAPAHNKYSEILSSDGFVVLGEIFDKNLILKIQARFQALILEEEKKGKNKYINFSEIAKQIPEIEHLLTPEISQTLRTHYQGGNFWLMSVQAWRNYHWPEAASNKDINSNLWHNDATPTNILKLFIFLSDGVSKNNGATRILSIKNTRKVMRTGYFNRQFIFGNAKRIVGNEANINYMEGGTGTSFIFNPQLCLHGAGVAMPNSFRDALCLQFAPTAVPLGSDWVNDIGNRSKAESY